MLRCGGSRSRRIDWSTKWIAPALGVAVSPLPVAAMLLLLGGERAVAKGTSFWLAWVADVAVPTAAFVLLAALRRAAARHGRVAGLVLGLLIGVYFGLDGLRRL